MITVSINTQITREAHSYGIHIASGLITATGVKAREVFPQAETIALVTDEAVKALYLETVRQSLDQQGFRVLCFTVPGGEVSKNADFYFSLLNWLAENRLTRTDAIVALGGGVLGDLAGFAAASYLRGIPVAQIPTTLLAMVDSSVGGKTAIDLHAGKNLAGAFYQPSLVLCDTDVLATLPSGVFNDGCAEVIKYGMIRDSALLEKIAARPIQDQLDEVIAACVGIKRDILQNDVFDTG